MHIVFVMDGSEAMAGRPSRDMREGALDLARALHLDQYPSTKVAVVEFQERERRLCGLTNDQSRVLSCIRRVGARGETSIEAGLGEALSVIRLGRRALHPREGATEVVVLFSQGHNEAGCREAVQASRSLRGAGVLMISVCIGRGCDEYCMRQLASSPRYYFRVENMGGLVGVFQQIRDRILNVNLKRVTVTDKLPDNMRYVPGSARPAPTMVSPDGDELTWEDVYIPKQGVTYTFNVEPLEIGRHVTNVDAHADLVANTGWEGTHVYPVPTVWVRPRPTPTTSYVPQPTPSRTPTATLMPLPSRSPTPNELGSSIWLPAVSR